MLQQHFLERPSHCWVLGHESVDQVLQEYFLMNCDGETKLPGYAIAIPQGREDLAQIISNKHVLKDVGSCLSEQSMTTERWLIPTAAKAMPRRLPVTPPRRPYGNNVSFQLPHTVLLPRPRAAATSTSGMDATSASAASTRAHVSPWGSGAAGVSADRVRLKNSVGQAPRVNRICTMCSVKILPWRTVCKRCVVVKQGGGRGSNEPSSPTMTPPHAFATKLSGAGTTPEPMQDVAAEEESSDDSWGDWGIDGLKE